MSFYADDSKSNSSRFRPMALTTSAPRNEQAETEI
jgi:hypothetical protein